MPRTRTGGIAVQLFGQIGLGSFVSFFVLLGVLAAGPTNAQVCPSASLLASTCRNGLCDASAGEDASTCPEDCADRSRQVLGYYTQAIACPPTTIHEPQSVQELQDAVRAVVSSGRKIKPAGTSHSATDLICADDGGDVIRTRHLTDIGPIEPFEGRPATVEVEAGVQINDLQEALHAQGYSFGLAATGYGGISIGGAVATGAHGSSLLGSSTLASYVVGLDVVGPDGSLTTYTEGTTGVSNPGRWAALRTNLGLLGIVVRIRLRLEPQFNMNVQVRYTTETAFTANGGVANAVAGCDYVFLTWFPGQNVVQYLCGTRAAPGAPSQPLAQNRLFTPDISGFEQAFAIPTLQSGMCFPSTQCFVEQQRVSMYQNKPPLVITDGPGIDAGVASRHTSLTGPSHRMITLPPEVFARQPALSQLEYEGALPMSQIQAAVQYLKSVYDRDGVCQPLIGTIMRFDRADGNLLMSANHARAGIAAGQQMVHLEFVEYWGYGLDAAGVAQFVSNPYTEIVEHLIDNFDYWPHWGKNDEWVFADAGVKARNAAERSIFNQSIAQMDPYGVFANGSSRRSGFVSPLAGQNFAQAYYGSCATQDPDGDGISSCTDRTPNAFSGMYVRIDDDGILSGSCNAADDWNEMKANFGADQEQNMRAGWEYDSENHSYHTSTFAWSPRWPLSGGNSWEALMSATFVAEDTGRYCFSQDNGATGTGIATGWNACSQVWINQTRVAEQGFDSSNTRIGCLNLTADQVVRLDFYDRHHNANVSRSFIARPRWCYGGTGNCTPNRRFEQRQLTARSSLAWP